MAVDPAAWPSVDHRPAANYSRGEGTFAPLETYRYGERKLVSNEPVVEVTVLYSVPDVRDLVVDVATR